MTTGTSGTFRTTTGDLMTRERWVEIARIAVVAVLILLYYIAAIPLPLLLVAVTIGLYLDRRRVRCGRRSTGDHPGGQLIAELNTDRARVSIKALIGSFRAEKTGIHDRGRDAERRHLNLQ